LIDMSGPKYSQYILEQQRRIALLRHQEETRRKREEEKRRALEAERQRLRAEKLKELDSLKASINPSFEQLLVAQNTISHINPIVSTDKWEKNFKALLRERASFFYQIESIDSSTSLEALQSLAVVVEHNSKEIISSIDKLKADALVLETEVEDISKSLIAQGFKTKLSFKQKKNNPIETKPSDAVQEVYNRLYHLKDSRLPRILIEEIDQKLEYARRLNESTVKNFIALSVKPLEQKCSKCIADINFLSSQLVELNPRYLILCEELGITPEQFTATEVSINCLKSEIIRLTEISNEFAERECIESSINEVMTEMGYSVLGNAEKHRKSGELIKKTLYEYDDGTAVNVTYSTGDRIVMEIGKLDDKDRLPNEFEQIELCHQMEEFCNDFNEIEHRLKEKGVLLKSRIKRLPPMPEYAQIINVSEYSNNGETIIIAKHRHEKINKNNERTVD